MANTSLSKAKNTKNDNFYTHIEDIEAELSHYKEYFKDKVVYCNCDDPIDSAFTKYFTEHFKELNLTLLITTKYNKDGVGELLTIDCTGKKSSTLLDSNGDFRSEECVALLQEADVVVTNPPFSLFREFISLLIENKKDFIIIGNQNTVTNKEMFPLIKNNQIWLGMTKVKSFTQDDGTEKTFGNVCWFTNIPNSRRNNELILTKTYDPVFYQHYDNYGAINISKVSEIPFDYYGVMGVPISFLEKYNPEQFEIIWQGSGNTRKCCPKETLDSLSYRPMKDDRGGCPIINGKRTYSRIFIRRVVESKAEDLDKIAVIKWLRSQTSLGLSECKDALDKLIFAMKHQPIKIMDYPYKLTIKWEHYEE